MAGSTEGYRNRIRVRVDASGQVSFFNTEKSWECIALEPSVADLLNRVRQLTEADPGLLRRALHFEARAADMDGRAALCVTTDPEVSFSSAGLSEALGPDLHVAENGKCSAGHGPEQRMDLGGGIFTRLPLGSFVQINTAVNRLLVDAVAQGAKERGLHTFLDLYAGAGNFTLPLLARGLRGVGVEIDEDAIGGARRAMTDQNLVDGEFLHGDAPGEARRLRSGGQRYDLVLIDPPRAGVRDGLDTMAELSSSHIAMCSCNPQSLARDVARLLSLGCELEEVTAFDMFPHTAHIEALVWLRSGYS